MVSAEILKKHNLKAVPFSCIREGETFCFGTALKVLTEPYQRRLIGDSVDFSDGCGSSFSANAMRYFVVYVPVWRPC